MGGIKVGELYAELKLDKRGFGSALSGAGQAFTKFGKVAAAGIAIAAAAIIGLGVLSGKNAIEQERATARVKQTYGKSAAAVNKWAEDSSRALGVNDDTLELSMAQYGDWAKNVGMSTKEAMQGGKDMATRASEISLATGKSFEEVFTGLFKGQQGMTRGLKEYGIVIGKQQLMDEALAEGLINEGDALDTASAARARGNLILQQSSQYTKTAADMQDGLVKKQREVGVAVDEVMDTLGVVFLNLAQAVMPTVVAAFTGFSDWVTANLPTIKSVMEESVAVIGAVLTFIFTEVMPRLVAAFVAFHAWIIENMPTIKSIIKIAGDVIGASWKVISEVIIPAVGKAFDYISKEVLPRLTNTIDTVRKNWDDFGPFFTGLAIGIAAVVGGVLTAAFVTWAIAAITAAGATMIALAPILIPIALIALAIGGLTWVWTHFGEDIKRIVGDIARNVGSVFGKMGDVVGGIWNGITGVIKGVFNGIVGMINGVIASINGFQIHFGGGPGGVGKFDFNGLNLAYLPGLASGTPNWGGGMAWVGERGPELVNIPAGAAVHSASDSRQIMGGKMEVTIRDPDGAVASGGYSQSDLERAVSAAVSALVMGAAHTGLRS